VELYLHSPIRLHGVVLSLGTETTLRLRSWNFSGFDSRWGLGIFYRVQTGSGAHPASYPMDTKGSFPGGIAAGA
jgi:hypothetical protein